MEIQKIFSEDNGDEKLYSVLLDDIELELFSEFQKEYARRDYEGLTNSEKEILRKKRGSYAKSLKKTYDDLKKGSNELDYGSSNTATATGDFSGGGVRTRIKVETSKDGRKAGAFQKAHDSAVTNALLEESKKAKEIMRKESFKPHHDIDAVNGKIGNWLGRSRQNIKDADSRVGNYRRSGINKDLEARTEAYKIKKAEKAAERAAQSQASIAKHAEKAKSLRKIRNIKRGAAGVAIGAGTLGVGYGVKKALEKNDEN